MGYRPSHRDNRMVWLANSGRFSNKSFHHLLTGDSAGNFPWKSTWNARIHKKIPFLGDVTCTLKCYPDFGQSTKEKKEVS
ncbi:hypothetical protein CsSME_00008498 [Camellia sinensis var. sinensis]